ncbi:MAG TPA: 50S ribosomal protein L17 [Phycisphaerae bacterium]|jgi:large subunit ribosomal protein L17
MRHRVDHRGLGRTTDHRRALLRNLAQSLIEHGEVRTTLPKAKELQRHVERLVTLAKRAQGGDLVARRQIHKHLSDRAIIPKENLSDYEAMSDAKRRTVLRTRSGRRHRTGQPRGHLTFTADSVMHRLIETVAPKYVDRPGGYTRLVRLPTWRIGDAGEIAVVQFVGDETAPGNLVKPLKSARQRRSESRYALAVKLSKGAGRRGGKPAAREGEPEEAPESTSEAT